MPIYLQAYLNLAHDRLEEQKKEAGRITNVDLQKKVSAQLPRWNHAKIYVYNMYRVDIF